MISKDILYMRRALGLARKAEGKTSPNPVVGCVIVKNGKIVGEGFHRCYGSAHAEVEALKKAGGNAKGAVMYVTLEPCSHWGKTPPCVEAVIKAGIVKVVAAMADPNPLNNGKSFKILKQHGVSVVIGACAVEARAMNAAFVKYMNKGMPFVTAKSAQTLDGNIGVRGGKTVWITANGTRALAKQRRAQFDAILVGVNTVIADDPLLDAPGKKIRKIIVDSTLRTPREAKMLKNAAPGQVILAVTKKAPLARRKQFEAAGTEVLVCPIRRGRVNLQWLLKALAKNKIMSILIEGGASVIGSALQDALVDRLHVYIAPKVLPQGFEQSLVAGLDVSELIRASKFRISAMRCVAPDLFMELQKE
ncbi:MAG: bifunctional diaminohydroxyphosphoribosylaminopyrimidine deaminase/5-amino-6-(5-phosphoribosylamino)uracil reductase RibD [Candidatus Omnitrophica bacterium]|nr:bifunctional diaminohydroxyphosphoribosylaminopyrimidine deaminase/5-amino-6-(5-phosphoribosylamino)uracil reductase RibD [Candidatus Omnitrophota bacterium]